MIVLHTYAAPHAPHYVTVAHVAAVQPYRDGARVWFVGAGCGPLEVREEVGCVVDMLLAARVAPPTTHADVLSDADGVARGQR